MICKVKQVLEVHGITQTQLVERTGISHGQMSRILNSQIEPGVVTAGKICRALDDMVGVEPDAHYCPLEMWTEADG